MIFPLFRCCRSTNAVVEQPSPVHDSGESTPDLGEPIRWRPALATILEGDETESDHKDVKVSHAWSLKKLLKRFR